MTVIAYRNGIFAADMAGWQNDIVVVCLQKIFRTRNNVVFAACGKGSDIQAHVRWLNSRRGPRPDLAGEDFEGLEADIGGAVYFVGTDHLRCEKVGEFAALGAHSDFLYGAMAAGASAEEAVRLAIKWCAFAGGEVQVERIGG